MKTTRIYQILTLAAILPWIAGCIVTSDDGEVENTPRKQYIQFRAGISAPVTRVAANAGVAGERSWSARDSIVILMENTTSGGGTYTYAQAVYAHGTTAGLSGATGTFTFQSTPSSPTTQPVFPLNGDALDFIAFYPYDPANTLPLASLNTYPIDITHQIPIGTGNGVRADFMWTKTPSPYSLSSPPSGGAIELNFEHLLVKLVVKITRDVVSLPTTWSGSTAATATIKNAVKEATVDLTAGTVAPSTTSVMDVAMRKETWKTGGGGTVPDTIIFEAILMPQTFDGNPSALDSLIVTVPVGSATRYYKSSLTNLFANFNGTGSALTAFTEKTKYTLIADLKGNMLTNISGIINPWLDGGQGSGVAHEQP